MAIVLIKARAVNDKIGISRWLRIPPGSMTLLNQREYRTLSARTLSGAEGCVILISVSLSALIPINAQIKNSRLKSARFIKTALIRLYIIISKDENEKAKLPAIR